MFRNEVIRWEIFFIPFDVQNLICEYEFELHGDLEQTINIQSEMKLKLSKWIKSTLKSCVWNMTLLFNGYLCLALRSGEIKIFDLKLQVISSFFINIICKDAKICLQSLFGNQIVLNNNNKLQIWNWKTKKCELEMVGHVSAIKCILVLKKNLTHIRIATGSMGNKIRIWNVTFCICERILRGHFGSVRCLANISEKRIVSGSEDSFLKIWNLETGECENSSFTYSKSIECVQVMDDEKIITGSLDGTIQVWRQIFTEKMPFLLREKILKNNLLPIDCLQCLSCFQVIIGSGKTIQVWNINNGLCEKVIHGHKKSVRKILIDQKITNKLATIYVISYSNDSIRIWS